jgi:RNA polymerase sigma-70 factor, ECF subfamily
MRERVKDLTDEGLLTRIGDEPGDDDLIRHMAEGDHRAFRQLMGRHGRAMLSLAERTTGNAADADELVQEVFLKVWTMAPRWRTDGAAQFSTWLYRVVLNASLDRRRRRPFSPLEEADEPVDDAANGLDRVLEGQRKAVVHQAMATLPERQRAALALHYFGETSAPEAARILDLSLSAMEALLVRGKRALRQALLRRGITGLGDVL